MIQFHLQLKNSDLISKCNSDTLNRRYTVKSFKLLTPGRIRDNSETQHTTCKK